MMTHSMYRVSTLRSALGSRFGGLAAALVDNEKLRLVAKGPASSRALRDFLREASDKEFAGATVFEVPGKRLRHCRTLVDARRAFGEGAVVYDPSRVLKRIERLQVFTDRLRQALPDSLAGVAFEADRMVVRVVLRKPDDDATREKVNFILIGAQRAAAEAVADLTASDPEFKPRLAITFWPHTGNGTPVDHASLRGLAKAQRRFWGRMAAGVLATFGLAGTPALAQDGVGQISGFGGSAGDDTTWGGHGSVSSVSTDGWGLQGSAQFNDRSDTFTGFSGHVFRRNSDGLIGLIGRVEDVDRLGRWAIGIEGELHGENHTFTGEIGMEDSDLTGEDFYGYGGVVFYPSDHAAFELIGGRAHGRTLGKAQFEFQPAVNSIPGLSLFAEGGGYEDGDGYAIGGIRFSFGAGSIRERDRQLIRERAPLVGPDYGDLVGSGSSGTSGSSGPV